MPDRIFPALAGFGMTIEQSHMSAGKPATTTSTSTANTAFPLATLRSHTRAASLRRPAKHHSTPMASIVAITARMTKDPTAHHELSWDTCHGTAPEHFGLILTLVATSGFNGTNVANEK